MKALQLISEDGLDGLQLTLVDSPTAAPGQVKVAVKSSAVNYRDLATVLAPAARGIQFPFVPNSDCAGEIITVGRGVSESLIGKRVCGCFFQSWQDGPCTTEAMNSALGGALPGVLAEEVCLDHRGVVEIPDYMSYQQASTLPCAALTAWNAIVVAGNCKPGDTVLLLGTGGVSLFAMQFANMVGARVIITSSSEDKLERVRKLGAWQTINYREHPEWEDEVLRLTDGRGVDVTVEVGGAGTLERSIIATRVAGTISLIGILTDGKINPVAVMRKSICLQGIYVGSRSMFSDMCKALDAHKIEPVIDQVFDLEHAPDAFRAMHKAGHFGKLVIAVR